MNNEMRPFLVFLFFPRHIRAHGREMEPRGVSLASRVHAAPALLRDTTNERGARDDAAASRRAGAKPYARHGAASMRRGAAGAAGALALARVARASAAAAAD